MRSTDGILSFFDCFRDRVVFLFVIFGKIGFLSLPLRSAASEYNISNTWDFGLEPEESQTFEGFWCYVYFFSVRFLRFELFFRATIPPLFSK